MYKILNKKNILRAILFSVILYLFLLLFMDMASSIIDQYFLKSGELTKFDITILIFLVLGFYGCFYLSTSITLKAIPDNKQSLIQKNKFKPTLEHKLIMLGIMLFVVIYSYIFTVAEFSVFQAIAYMIFGMFLCSLITVVLRIYCINKEIVDKELADHADK